MLTSFLSIETGCSPTGAERVAMMPASLSLYLIYSDSFLIMTDVTMASGLVGHHSLPGVPSRWDYAPVTASTPISTTTADYHGPNLRLDFRSSRSAAGPDSGPGGAYGQRLVVAQILHAGVVLSA